MKYFWKRFFCISETFVMFGFNEPYTNLRLYDKKKHFNSILKSSFLRAVDPSSQSVSTDLNLICQLEEGESGLRFTNPFSNVLSRCLCVSAHSICCPLQPVGLCTGAAGDEGGIYHLPPRRGHSDCPEAPGTSLLWRVSRELECHCQDSSSPLPIPGAISPRSTTGSSSTNCSTFSKWRTL